MEDINTYIQRPQAERQEHLDLDSPCVERGPDKHSISIECKGLMAHILDTTMPVGCKIHLCHACHNSKCSNPDHLYWGTASENCKDRIANGGRNVWENTVLKYGEEKAHAMNGRPGNTFGKANKNVPKTEEHKEKIAIAIKNLAS